MSTPPTTRRVVVIGGGYVGAPLAQALDADHDVTLIDRLPMFFHRMAALRAAVDPASTDLPFLSREKLLTRGRVLTGEVVSLDADGRVIQLADGTTVRYDVAVIATGAVNQRVAQFEGSDLSAAREHFLALQREIRDSAAVAVIGGGVTGVELAGEVSATYPDKRVALFTRGRLVPDLPAKAAASLARQLSERGVRVFEGHAVTDETVGAALSEAGMDPDATLVLWTVGSAPVVDWLAGTHPELVGDGGVLVDEFLRVGGRDDLYAVGDVAATDGPQGAMVARAQIPVIKANITGGRPLRAYRAKGPRIALVPLGRVGGVVSVGFGGGGVLLGGRAASAAKGKTLMTPMIKSMLRDTE